MIATGGTNTLNVTIAGSATATDNSAMISGFQTVNLRNTGTGNASLDASFTPGATSVNSNISSGAGTLTVTNLATGASAGINGNGAAQTAAFTFGYKTAADAATLNVRGGAYAGNVTISTTPTAVTVNSTGAANTIGSLTLGNSATALTINAAVGLTTGGVATSTGLKTITVTGAASTAAAFLSPAANDITSAVQLGTLVSSVTTVDASAMTAGGVSATLVAAVTSFKGGAGTDTVTSEALTSVTASIIDGGTGTDVLRVGAVTNIDTAAEAQQYANFEVLDTMATSTSIDMSLFTNSTIGAVRVGGNAILTKMTATQAANVTVYATSNGSYSINNATDPGTVNTLTLTVNDSLVAQNLISFSNLTAAGAENINIINNEVLTISSLTGSAALENLKLSGTGAVTLTTSTLAINTNTIIDATAIAVTSGTAFTLDARAASTNGLAILGASANNNAIIGSAQIDSYTGGSKVDTIRTLAGADIINAGAGNDVVIGGLGADRITLGDGADTLTLRPGDTYAYQTGGTAMASLITVDDMAGTAPGGTATVSVTVNGITATAVTATASSSQTANEIIIANALKAAIDGNAELASYVSTAVTGTSSGILTLTSAAKTPISIGAVSVGAWTTAAGTVASFAVTNADTDSTASSGTLSVESVTDINFGGSTLATAVDVISLTGVTATALTVVTGGAMTGSTIGAGVNALFEAGGSLNGTTNTVGIFTFGADSYLVGNLGTATSASAAFGMAGVISDTASLLNQSDFVIKITGFSGTLDASDFTFVA